jgi:hypothetical protein
MATETSQTEVIIAPEVQAILPTFVHWKDHEGDTTDYYWHHKDGNNLPAECAYCSEEIDEDCDYTECAICSDICCGDEMCRDSSEDYVKDGILYEVCQTCICTTKDETRHELYLALKQHEQTDRERQEADKQREERKETNKKRERADEVCTAENRSHAQPPASKRCKLNESVSLEEDDGPDARKSNDSDD